MTTSQVQIARVYDASTDQHAMRVLVDRLWPRGLAKARADIDEWCQLVAPSPELRKWYGHDPTQFTQFRHRYRAELATGEQADALARLRQLAKNHTLVLLTASKDVSISQAAVLSELLNDS
ncbi:DUF488 domain-containing protein [Paractinoplanes rishiriensis]|uniref:DUF488 family protein n=1 Tax=Paractinoplanes rishiriensis TaxID=1050105 RepID=A0A919K9W3_9ACTN|nr:DUF488 family protein [Actinoplanes rishiriensis]GIF01164.1 hypothetical protein Ari01nite_86280 [Actinoplanes rishiriensis]